MYKIDGFIPCPFVVDSKYKVIKATCDFTVGEIIRFKRAGFERMEDEFGYAFSVPAVPNLMKIWRSKDATDWQEYFEKIRSF